MHRILPALLLLPALVCAEPIELRRGDVVAFVGGTDLVRLQEDGRIEAALTRQFLDAQPRFRDLAWEGDTVFHQGTVQERWRKQAYGDLEQQLKKVGATVVIAQFGKIESLAGAAGLPRFTRAASELLRRLRGDQRRVYLLEPVRIEHEGYATALRTLAEEQGIPFVALDAFDTGAPRNGIEAVRLKHRLWYEYWRPANWKCLFGDDARRRFSNAAEGRPSFKEEWSRYPALIAAAEQSIFDGRPVGMKPPRELTGSPEANLEKELAAFELLDGFEVNCFADESLGIANPLSIRWGADGTAYVACSDVYPQIEPGTLPDDKLIALRDTDHDGRADTSKIFARGLNIPTGMEVDAGRVLVGQGTELLALRDTTGDGVADERVLLLSGFGNGDSHQTMNSFAWSPDGELWFCQGDGIESRVETPFGVSSLFQAGVFRLRPHEMRLDGLLDDFMGPGNPWGVAFDDFGQSFVIDGAGGVSYLTPASIPAKRRLKLPRIGKPGGYCGIDCLAAATIPVAMRNEFVIGDYKKNQVSRFAVEDDGAGFKLSWRKPLLRSSHRNFRPIDVKMGPDGAIYIVDWYNPITCHQDDFYRHPKRDKTHGRIWRVAPKSGVIKPPALAGAPLNELVAALASTERWTRTKAKQQLSLHPRPAVRKALRSWVAGRSGAALVEAAGALAWRGETDPELLAHLLRDPDPRARAYGARLAGRGKNWPLLEQAAGDPHPRVRMEAVLAAGAIPEARAVLVAAAAAGQPRDRWIDYAFKQAVHQLRPHWEPAFHTGSLDFGDHGRGLAAVLAESNSKQLLSQIRKRLGSGELDREATIKLCRSLVSVGEDGDLVFALKLDPPSPELLEALHARSRPNLDVGPHVIRSLQASPLETRIAALRLAGHWRVEEGRELVLNRLAETKGDERGAVIQSLGAYGGARARQALQRVLDDEKDPDRGRAVAAMMRVDVPAAIEAGARIIAVSKDHALLREVLAAAMSRREGGSRLAKSLETVKPADPEQLRRSWVATGLVDAALSSRIDALAGFSAAGPDYSEARVKRLVAAAGKGDRAKGKALFESDRLGCTACHKVGTRGGVIGPDLSAVGSGVPAERLVTEVFWPARQVKEGYALSRITLKDGRVLQGYEQAGRDKRRLLLRDFASGVLMDYARGDLAKQDRLGSFMPPTARVLHEAEQADLIAYLLGLNGRDQNF